jgi:hypothetical protein
MIFFKPSENVRWLELCLTLKEWRNKYRENTRADAAVPKGLAAARVVRFCGEVFPLPVVYFGK